VPLTPPIALPTAAAPTDPVHVEVGGHRIGRDTFTVIAGPCSVTRFEQTLRVAKAVKQAGATMFRGGAYKPRTDPRSFQGLAELGLAMLLEAKAATGLMIVTEVLDVRDLELVLTVADIVQVGARNMQNTGLLRELGRAGCPVLLKRGLAATIDETIGAAEYIRCEGNHDVMLCERGIRTFESRYRFSLDLTAVPIMQECSGLPVLIDPSHAPGRRDLVLRLSKAAAAVGADGLIVEVDESPDEALSDGPQQLSSHTFADYMREVHRVARGEGRAL
jgi:3-deoxy-7-phosphoheptulonate synthase